MNTPIISIVAIIAKNRAIGCNNKLLYNIPEDMDHFREITTGHPVIMGRRTFESIGRPLPDRINIVISLIEECFEASKCLNVHSLEDAIETAKKLDDKEIFIIGGGSIYNQALNIADKLYLTIVDDEPRDADTYFPDYSDFKKIVNETHLTASGYELKFCEMVRG